MKKTKCLLFLMFFLLGFFLFSKTVSATSIENWKTDVSLDNDGSTYWIVNINYSEQITKTDYWIFFSVTNLEVLAGNTSITCITEERELGTSILCKDIDKSINTTSIAYKFKTQGQVGVFKDFKMFRYTFPVTEITKNISITIRLPLGAVLIDKTKLKGMPIAPFEPAFGNEGSDGRNIFIKWEVSNPKLGESLNTYVIFESIISADIIIVAIIAIIAVSFIVFYYLRYVRINERDILAVLSENEKRVMEIVLRERKVDQRQIVRETDFSKAKASRIIQNLTARGIVEAIQKGRTKIITVKTRKKPGISEIFSDTKKKYKLSALKLNRDQAVELIQEFLTPMIDLLSKETNLTQTKNYSWAPDVLKPIKISQRISALHNDIKRIYPATDEKITKHNIFIEDMNKEINKIIKSVLSKKFVLRCEAIIEKFNKENNENISADCIDQFALHIIDNKLKIDTPYEHHKLWEKYHKQILKIRETKPIKHHVEILEKMAENFEKFMWQFKEDLENIREELRTNYNVLVKEFYKK